MSQRLKNGYELLKDAIRALGNHPRMLLPLLGCWCVYAPVLVFLKFHLPWEEYALEIQALIVFGVILLFSIVFSWAAFMLLELIRQIETADRENVVTALFKSVANTVIALPIAVLWAVIWFLLSVVEAILSRGSDEDDIDDEGASDFNAENVARTLAGAEKFSLTAAFFDALKKGVRMVAFLMYPAIAWEKLSVIKSMKKGIAVASTHKIEFATGFVLTELAAGIVFLPPAILFLLSGKFDVSFPDVVWFGTMIYCAFAWSFALFLEQMFVAELYLWHMHWEQEVTNAKASGRPEPALADVKRPSRNG